MLLFQTSSAPVSIQQCHPSPTDAFLLWQAFVDNVDSLVKIIHTPTVQSKLVQASLRPDSIEPSLEALMFAIYYAATISTQTGQASEQNQVTPLGTYRWALNQALCRAGFFQRSRDITSLQAFVIYLVRYTCTTQSWSKHSPRDGLTSFATDLCSSGQRQPMRLDTREPCNPSRHASRSTSRQDFSESFSL